MKKVSFVLLLTLLLSLTFINLKQRSVRAQSLGPEMLVPNPAVRTTITDLIIPISMAFLGVNFNSERGLDLSKEVNMAAKSSESQVTTDHDEIRRWVEERGGHPARVKDTESKNSPGLLRIDYPGYSGGDSLEAISWDEFFTGFDENNLAFLYQEKTKDGNESRFSKLIDRDSADDRGH
jgi:hypothetical protein